MTVVPLICWTCSGFYSLIVNFHDRTHYFPWHKTGTKVSTLQHVCTYYLIDSFIDPFIIASIKSYEIADLCLRHFLCWASDTYEIALTSLFSINLPQLLETSRAKQSPVTITHAQGQWSFNLKVVISPHVREMLSKNQRHDVSIQTASCSVKNKTKQTTKNCRVRVASLWPSVKPFHENSAWAQVRKLIH